MEKSFKMLPETIRALRNEKGISQSLLAKELGLTQQAIAKWEKGIAEPDSVTLVKLASLFKVSTDYLLGCTPIRTPGATNNDLPSDVKAMLRDYAKLNDEQKEIFKRLIKEFINEKK